MLCGCLLTSLALVEKAPLPAPSFKKSRKIFMCTPAQVSSGENSVVAGDQVKRLATGQLSTNVTETPRRPLQRAPGS